MRSGVRGMNQLEMAVHRTAHDFPGGIPALAAAMGQKPGVLKNKVDPNSEWNKLSLDEALQMMLLANDRRILSELARELGCEVQGGRPMRNEHLIESLLKEQAEHGDVASMLAKVLEDGRVTPREAFEVAREIDDEIQALTQLKHSVQAAADNATPVFRAA